jgi:adenine nucleotide transporter 17
MFDELRAVAREDGGLSGLYRGIEPAVIGTVTSQTVYNYFYAVLRNASARRRQSSAKGEAPSALESLAIASVAGAINVLLTIPIWTVCVRMQAERANEEDANAPRPNAAPPARREKKNASNVVSSFFSSSRTKAAADGSSSPDDASPRADDRSVKMKKKKTFFETTAAVWHENGAAGFWRGVVPSLMMVANPALQYAFYERAGDSFLRRRRGENKRHELFKAHRVGGVSRRVVREDGRHGVDVPGAPGEDPAAGEREKRGRLRTTERLTRFAASRSEEGVHAFYRGMGTKMTQTVFAAALMFVTKEEIAKAVGKVAARRARRGA